MSSSLIRSKSLNRPDPSSSSTSGYLSPARLKENKVIVSAVDDDDEEDDIGGAIGIGLALEDPEGVTSPQEGPFSALTPSMWPSMFMSEKKTKVRGRSRNRNKQENEETEGRIDL